MSELRELVAREVFALDEDWRREYWLQFRREYPLQAGVYYDTADRILAIVRTPRGEGEAEAMSANLARALAAMQAAWIEWRRGRGADAAMQWIENTLIGPGLIPGDDESDAQAFFDRAIAEIENHQIRDAAALRSEAQGEADEHASCTCEWMHPTLGTINPHWPAVLDPECIVHNEAHAARRSDGGGK